MAKRINYAALYTLRKDGRYQGSYTDDKGRHYVYDRDPERLWHKLNDPKPKPAVTFSTLAEEWEEQHRERVGYKTWEAYTAPLRRIKERFGEQEELTAAEIAAYLDHLARLGYSRRTVQMHRDILHMIYNTAIVNGRARYNPCDAVSLPRNLPVQKRTLPGDDAIEAVKKAGSHPFGLFALICLYSGVRRGEALALRYEDIDRENKLIHITKSVVFLGNDPNIKEPKTKAGYRDAILLDVLAEAIPNGKGYIFCGDGGKLLTKTQYRKRWLAYCKAIGHDITAHQLRHGFATILYEAGIPDKDAQELLGHSSIAVTRDIYTHIRSSRRDATAAKLNAFTCQK